MAPNSSSGQVIFEVLITIIFFLSLGSLIGHHIDGHQKRVRLLYQEHKVKNANKQKIDRFKKSAY